jgi:acetoin:2,6-dichlorophenolindophenol oxidoreductase subunit beta
MTDIARTDSGTEEVILYRDAVNAALVDEMTTDDRVLLMGEDVGVQGGVFKTNEGLVETFGRGRIIDTPICENGFLGVALGMAVNGFRPVVEIMFADFLPTGADALVNEISKFRFMSGGQTPVPLTIRAIGGGTGRFGTQHSATAESWYMQSAGLSICAASSPAAAYGLLRTAIRWPNPVLVLEHKALLNIRGPVRRGDAGFADFGKAQVVRPGADVTVVATLLMAERALAAAATLAEEGVDVEVLDLRWISPIDYATVAASVEKTGRLVVAEEQYHAGGWGSAVISDLAMEGVRLRARPAAASFPAGIPMPFSPPLEDHVIPSVDRIADTIRSVMAQRQVGEGLRS